MTSVHLTGLLHYLLQDGLLDIKIAKEVAQKIREKDIPLTKYLVESGVLSSQMILSCCVKYFKLPIFDIKNYNHPWQPHPILHADLVHRYHVIPLHKTKEYLSLAMTDPTHLETITAIRFHTGLPIRPILISEEILSDLMKTYYSPNILNSQLESVLSKITPFEEPPVKNEDKNSVDEPVVEFVNQLLLDAINKKISDIHIEPYQPHCRIRFRRDGLLYEATIIPLHLAERIITRLKILSHLNIAERRLPQDGHFQFDQSKIDIRLNTCPTLFGEKTVLRLLYPKKNLDISALGLTKKQEELFASTLDEPQGLILVTGPTGSGKTITLYTALNYLNKIEKNISSVEDPIEIELTGINQININPKIGLDFAMSLRNLLRQDPDIIMIGEIRDQETADIAIQAALTGHLVLSTLHANDTLNTFSRLQSIGIAQERLASAISLVIAQRLVRKLCNRCKISSAPPDFMQKPCFYFINHDKGCDYCHQGYQGRIGIFELLAITKKTRNQFFKGISINQIREKLKQEGRLLLKEAGLKKVREGITSMAEIKRVIGEVKCLT